MPHYCQEAAQEIRSCLARWEAAFNRCTAQNHGTEMIGIIVI